MDNSRDTWRKTKEENSYYYIQKGVGSKPRSQNRRRSFSGWQSSPWERKFCATAGVPWKKVLETQKYMYMDLDQKVLQWNDSAVEEAYWNAKTRFWAQIHGQHCNIELPDPDIFIDKIDWDSDNVDPHLISDEPEPPNKDEGVVLGIPVVPEQYLSTPTGWGDLEETETKQPKDYYDYVPQNRNNGYKYNGNSNMSRYKITRFDNNGNCGPSFVDERPVIKWRPVTRQC